MTSALSSCRCCVALTRPARLRLSHSLSAFSTSSALAAAPDRKPLPSTNWGAYKPDNSRSQGRSGTSGGFDTGGDGLQRRNDRGVNDSGPSRGGGFGLNRGGSSAGGRNGEGQDRPRSLRQDAGGFGQRSSGFRGGFGSNQDNTGNYASKFGLNRGGSSNSAQKPRTESDRFSTSSSSTGRDSRNRFGQASTSRAPRAGSDPSGSMPPTVQPTTETEDGDLGDAAVSFDGGDLDTAGPSKRRDKKQKGGSRLEMDEESEDFEIVRGGRRKSGVYEKPKARDPREDEWEKRRVQREKDRLEQQRLAEQERRVIIPSNVTVNRLASIFDVKLCKSRGRSRGAAADSTQSDYKPR